jgi:hypothetical protein
MKIRLSALKRLIREAVEGGAGVVSIPVIRRDRNGDPAQGALRAAGQEWVDAWVNEVDPNGVPTYEEQEAALQDILAANNLPPQFADEIRMGMRDAVEY